MKETNKEISSVTPTTTIAGYIRFITTKHAAQLTCIHVYLGKVNEREDWSIFGSVDCRVKTTCSSSCMLLAS